MTSPQLSTLSNILYCHGFIPLSRYCKPTGWMSQSRDKPATLGCSDSLRLLGAYESSHQYWADCRHFKLRSIVPILGNLGSKNPTYGFWRSFPDSRPGITISKTSLADPCIWKAWSRSAKKSTGPALSICIQCKSTEID